MHPVIKRWRFVFPLLSGCLLSRAARPSSAFFWSFYLLRYRTGTVYAGTGRFLLVAATIVVCFDLDFHKIINESLLLFYFEITFSRFRLMDDSCLDWTRASTRLAISTSHLAGWRLVVNRSSRSARHKHRSSMVTSHVQCFPASSDLGLDKL